MNAKQHCTIGAVTGLVGSYAYLGGNLQPSNLKDVVVPVIVGSVVGSILVDIDSKKSKASQIFNKIVMGSALFLGASFYLNLPIMDSVMSMVKDNFMGNLGLLIVLINLVLGKFSSHRGYTHRWLGTFVAIASAFMAFNKMFAVGYSLGYVLHILADRTTADGKNLKFFKLHLPLTNSKGKFHVSV